MTITLDSPSTQRILWRVILGSSALVAISSAAVSLLILNNPASPPVSTTPVNPGDKLYLYLYVARAVTLSTITLAALSTRVRPAIIPTIALLGANQLADSIIGPTTGHGFNPVPAAQGLLLLLSAGYLTTTATRQPLPRT
ncbi:hypothetical protein [Nocardia sp. NPDC020380]|uniref:hypothetical protein n=1 Tax=Nocardia sp. NPDC020380 TaxID=3364309 RepID=UPI0037940C8A